MNQFDVTNRIVMLATDLLELTKQLEPAAPQGPLPVEVVDQPHSQGEVDEGPTGVVARSWPPPSRWRP
jgi:hypothetical protein